VDDADKDWEGQADGDQETAVAELVYGYAPELRRFLIRMGTRPIDVDDLLQETFVKALCGLGRYRERGRLRAWLYRIALNTYLDWERRPQRSLEVPGVEGLTEESARDQPEELAVASGLGDQVRSALLRLPREQRSILVLRFYHDLSLGEIARAVGCPVNTVKSRLRLGLSRLRSVLEEQGVIP
jgi:RNA polymerase sigma-70 factor (ECF subfamily)